MGRRIVKPVLRTRAARRNPSGANGSSVATRLTTIEINESKFAEAKAALGTRTLRETVDRAFDEVLAHAARGRSIARLQSMEGLDLDKPTVMEKAWR